MSDFLNFKFYLNFKNDDSFGRIEITEPVGFDGSSFVIEQESKRYGRDAFKFNEEVNLTFYKGNFEPSEMQELPNGTVIYHLTQGYDWLQETIDKWGFETDIDFEIELNGVVFIPANLDIATSEGDGYSYITCKAVQEQAKQIINRRADIETDIFSTVDLDDNEIEPATTENILVRAKPVVQVSEWESLGSARFYHTFLSGGGSTVYYNQILNLSESNIENSLNYFNNYTSLESDLSNFGFIDALNNLTDVVIDLDFTATFKKVVGDFTNNPGSKLVLMYRVISDLDDPIGSTLSFGFLSGYNGWTISNSEPSIDIDFSVSETIEVPAGYRLIMYFEQDTAFLGGGKTELEITDYNINITATATAIDTVVKGVRYIDVIKANMKRINGYEVYAPKYDVGGEYYDQFAFTGNLIKQRDDVGFYVTFKDLMADLMELNSDYQITDKLYIGQYTDYYANNEIGAFLTAPDESFKYTFNERYAINELNFKYQTYEQDDDEENTIDAIHTDTQWLPSNLQVENSKDIDIKYIRDAFKLQKMIDDSSKDTTSTDDDDKMVLLDVVPLAPSTKGGFSTTMTHNINDDGQVQLLKDSDLPSWAVLGFDVGNTFFINSEDNEGEYTVAEIENTIITLTPVNPSTQSFTGETLTKVEYPFSNVAWVNRTNEGLVYSENLLNADNYANLKYSIKRNLEHWKPYIDTALMYKPNGTFKNTYYKDNGDAITRFEWEVNNVQENATITKDELNSKVITAKLYETKLVASYDAMVNVINAIDTVNSDGTIGGFIRCIDNNEKVINLYPQKLEYVPSTNELTLTGEERFDGDGVNIVIDGDTITINEVGYDAVDLSSPFYEYNGNFFKIYDKNHLPVINPTKYDEITVNGNTFDSSEYLLDYLINL